MDSVKTAPHCSENILVSFHYKLDLKICKIDIFDHVAISEFSKNVRYHIGDEFPILLS